MEHAIVKDLILFGSICGAFFAIWRLFDRIKVRGAEEQLVKDKIQNLERQIVQGGTKDGRLFEKIDELRAMVQDLKLQVSRDHAALSERLVRLEATGCEPVKK